MPKEQKGRRFIERDSNEERELILKLVRKWDSYDRYIYHSEGGALRGFSYEYPLISREKKLRDYQKTLREIEAYRRSLEEGNSPT